MNALHRAIHISSFESDRVYAVAVQGSSHSYKYRLFYGRPGKRIVGYDNERPKGDHRHVDGREQRYTFKDVETLVRDFLGDVQQRRSK